MSDGKRYTLSKKDSDELLQKFLALFDQDRIPKAWEAEELEASYGGIDFRLLEEVIDRKVQELTDTPINDQASRRKEIDNLTDKKRMLIKARTKLIERDRAMIRAEIKQQEQHTPPSLLWGKSTPAIGSNQVKSRDSTYDDTSDNQEAATRQRYTRIDSGIIDTCRKGSCHHNATALLLLLIMERAYRDKKDRHNTWGHWRLKRGVDSQIIWWGFS